MSSSFSNRLASLVLAGTIAACAPVLLRAADAAMPPAAPVVTTAVAVLSPTQGNEVHGTVRFTKVATGVRVVADLTGLKPGEHGFHVHEFGDATSADGMATGGHFNPMHEVHGGPSSEHRNEGDLGNITADASGHATLDYVDSKLAFDGTGSILGRSVVIHADRDDIAAQPSGNAGKRVAVGVIGIVKSP